MMGAAENAERLALALVTGDVPASHLADAREQLHLRAAEADRQAEALRRYRDRQPVWTWPAIAPWAGF